MVSNSDTTRNITICGHVDHGKTTFTDSLLAANNIISSRLAGKVRYLDSREDEQQRGITMESSAVSLRFTTAAKPGEQTTTTYTINLIDTPGHVDFLSEVSSASRLCDGALVLVDVVEGVCTQTIAVLRQCWENRLRPILVLNKFDRLITELKFAPVEAYHHLSQLIEQVNAVMGSFFASARLEDHLRWREERERRMAARKATAEAAEDAAAEEVQNTAEESFQEKDDEDIYFAPERGNVIFASAIDGWAFRIGKFAQLFASKLGINEANLRKVLWGDFYLEPKTKRVIGQKQLRGRNLKPLFVQIVLDNIWAAYDSVMMNPNPDKVEKIVKALNLNILPRDLKSKNTRNLLNLVFSQWLPLATCTVQAVIDIIPPPSSSQQYRIPKILYPDISEDTIEPKNKLERDLFECNSDDAAFVGAYVSKMFAVPKKDFPEHKKKTLTAEEMRERGRIARETAAAGNALPPSKDESPDAGPTKDGVEEGEVLLGFARLYSGRLRVGSHIFALLPKYDSAVPPSHPRNTKFIHTARIEALYTMMGRDLVPVNEVLAGNVFAVAGLEGKVWRCATLCSPGAGGVAEEVTLGNLSGDEQASLVNLGSVHIRNAPIVRVALEPAEPADMQKMVKGLRLLAHSDPCVEAFQQQTGEWVILTAGELHLERCLKDLRERFAKVEIQASKPIVPFRETAVKAPDMIPPKTANASRGTMHGSSAQSIANFTIRAVPLPSNVTKFLRANLSVIKRLERDRLQSETQERSLVSNDDEENMISTAAAEGDFIQIPTVRAEDFWEALYALLDKLGGDWKGSGRRIWAFGPNGSGPNLLIDSRADSDGRHLKSHKKNENQESHLDSSSRLLRDFESNLETGFQVATFQGPLCAEPVQGMAFFVEKLDVNEQVAHEEDAHSKLASAKGSLISTVRDACRKGILDWSPRLMLAMYSCDIQASTDVLGKVYGVVARRRGRIIAEEMKEGQTFFTVSALLPVVESFGFADDIRKRTSGAASPQLIFNGYEMLDQDPFWVPTTEEELEDLGEKADRANVARGYMDAVRERKGMFVDKKLVEHAEKQRTLKR